jgi:hypothetical protein
VENNLHQVGRLLKKDVLTGNYSKGKVPKSGLGKKIQKYKMFVSV